MQNKYPAEVRRVYYHMSDFSSLDEYLDIARKPVIAEWEAEIFKEGIEMGNFYSMLDAYRKSSEN